MKRITIVLVVDCNIEDNRRIAIMRCTNLITCAVMTAISSVAYADTLLVPSEYGSIQSGIDAAIEGDIVSVEAGIYYETIDFIGKAITVSSADGDTSGTFIDGGVSSDSVVKFVTAETAKSILDGFTIRNAEGKGISSENSNPQLKNLILENNHNIYSGGGIYLTSRGHFAEEEPPDTILISNIISRNN